MKYRLSDAAFSSLEAIGENTEKQWGIKQRDKYLEAIDAAFGLIALSPRAGRPCDHLAQGLRSYREGSHVIFYLIADDEVLITDILHERMDVDARMESWTQH